MSRAFLPFIQRGNADGPTAQSSPRDEFVRLWLTASWQQRRGCVEDARLTVDDFNVIGAGTQVQVLLSGGTAYERYAVLCHVATTGAAEDERTMYLYVQAR